MSSAPPSLSRRQIMPVRIIKRADRRDLTRGDNNYIRARYLEKLRVAPVHHYPRQASPQGPLTNHSHDDHLLSLSSSVSSCASSMSIAPPPPPPPSRPPLLSSSVSSSRSLPSPSCFIHKRSVLHTTPAKRERVSFDGKVRLYRIKSHRDYSDEEWNSTWVDPDELGYAKDRNSFEYQSDGAEWQTATEEDDFMEIPSPDGSGTELVHPATWVAYKQASVAATATGTAPKTQQGRIDFAALTLLVQQEQMRDQLRATSRRRRRSSWSPRPTYERKKSLSSWLLDLAIESVAAAKSASNKRGAANNQNRWQQQVQQAQIRMGFP